MTVSDWLVDSMVRLKQAGIPNGRTDCLVLLKDLFNVDKSWVHTHPEYELSSAHQQELERSLTKRLNHTPLAYIRGFVEFYGRSFNINDSVLIPRPESESFIELIKGLNLKSPYIADVGTGSGCLGITAALEVPEATVDLYDIDSGALKVASDNMRQYDLTLDCHISDLLKSFHRSYDVLLANLPYVPNELITSPEITKEPALALFSGDDGLNHYRKFWQQVSKLEEPPLYVLTESLINQHDVVTELAHSANYELVKTDLLVNLYRKN